MAFRIKAIWTLLLSMTSTAQYQACISGRYGPRCDGLCACTEHEDCDDGPDGDGSCTCMLGRERQCGLPEPATLAPIIEKASGYSNLAELLLKNVTLSSLRIDSDTMRSPRQVFNASLSLVRPNNWKTTSPRLVLFNGVAAGKLGLSANSVRADSTHFERIFSGQELLPGMQPFAHAYGGHQFGNWAGQLGDGRALTLSDVLGYSTGKVKLRIRCLVGGSGRLL